MKVGITLSKHAYTPESYAYYDFLISKGFNVQLDYILDPNNDINIDIMGIQPFWTERKAKCIKIHEYQSLSTRPFAELKNIIKRNINEKPNGRIYLNDFVRSEMCFSDSIPFIIRDMGIDKNFFQTPNEEPDFDITYCGSISGRKGLIEEIIRLSIIGLKIQVIGSIELKTVQIFKKYANIKILGRVCRSEIPELYKNSKCGLNFVPDIYPFNKQTSTKVLEYIASDLIVLSNKYEWISDFSDNNNFNINWLNHINDIQDIETIYRNNVENKSKLNLEDREWNNLLDRCGFDKFLLSLVKN